MIILSEMIDNSENLTKFKLIYKSYRQPIYSVAYNISKNAQDAEDIVEASLIKIIEILYSIAPEEIDSVKGRKLMIAITKNTAVDYLRKRK